MSLPYQHQQQQPSFLLCTLYGISRVIEKIYCACIPRRVRRHTDTLILVMVVVGCQLPYAMAQSARYIWHNPSCVLALLNWKAWMYVLEGLGNVMLNITIMGLIRLLQLGEKHLPRWGRWICQNILAALGPVETRTANGLVELFGGRGEDVGDVLEREQSNYYEGPKEEDICPCFTIVEDYGTVRERKDSGYLGMGKGAFEMTRDEGEGVEDRWRFLAERRRVCWGKEWESLRV